MLVAMTSCVEPFEIGPNQSHIGGDAAELAKAAVVPAVHRAGASSGGFPNEFAVEKSEARGQKL
jgi:hypothetical protein